VAWLCANGYPAAGYDASRGLLAEARRRYPLCRFEQAELPQLSTIEPESFDNVICETVIMHLPVADIAPSVRRLVEILKAGGTLYLSWRVTKGADQRDNCQRLYSAFDAQLVRDELQDTEIMLDEEVVSASSGKIIHRIVARR
jgi:2-polyprenyl-3-methyl-5-hydroxy-6-metoxy-1,4-benzoquinol methylase